VLRAPSRAHTCPLNRVVSHESARELLAFAIGTAVGARATGIPHVRHRFRHQSPVHV